MRFDVGSGDTTIVAAVARTCRPGFGRDSTRRYAHGTRRAATRPTTATKPPVRSAGIAAPWRLCRPLTASIGRWAGKPGATDVGSRHNRKLVIQATLAVVGARCTARSRERPDPGLGS